MARDPVPEELRRFILTSVPSVPFVEALLVFREAHGKPIDTGFVSRRLYLPEKAAAEVVDQLVAARFIEADPAATGMHRFAPHQDLESMVETLATYYRSQLLEVTDIIHSRTGRMAQQFANAFKWRKEP